MLRSLSLGITGHNIYFTNNRDVCTFFFVLTVSHKRADNQTDRQANHQASNYSPGLIDTHSSRKLCGLIMLDEIFLLKCKRIGLMEKIYIIVENSWLDKWRGSESAIQSRGRCTISKRNFSNLTPKERWRHRVGWWRHPFDVQTTQGQDGGWFAGGTGLWEHQTIQYTVHQHNICKAKRSFSPLFWHLAWRWTVHLLTRKKWHARWRHRKYPPRPNARIGFWPNFVFPYVSSIGSREYGSSVTIYTMTSSDATTTSFLKYAHTRTWRHQLWGQSDSKT